MLSALMRKPDKAYYKSISASIIEKLMVIEMKRKQLWRQEEGGFSENISRSDVVSNRH